jgi:hypothetical protein
MDALTPTVALEKEVEVLDISNWDNASHNPHNWPLWKKIYHTWICASYAFTMCAEFQCL